MDSGNVARTRTAGCVSPAQLLASAAVIDDLWPFTPACTPATRSMRTSTSYHMGDTTSTQMDLFTETPQVSGFTLVACIFFSVLHEHVRCRGHRCLGGRLTLRKSISWSVCLWISPSDISHRIQHQRVKSIGLLSKR